MADIKVRINRNKCCYCGACVSICPVEQGALELEEVILKVNHNICIECGICVEICPVGALSMGRLK